MKAEINKGVELVQILLFLAKEQEKTVQCINNKSYLKNISDWFEMYKDYAAVQITKKLVSENCFFHIRPLKAIWIYLLSFLGYPLPGRSVDSVAALGFSLLGTGLLLSHIPLGMVGIGLFLSTFFIFIPLIRFRKHYT